jgi:protein-disulfide isomerase
MAAEKNTSKSGQSGLTPKQLAEQARAESEAAERRRERTIRIVGGIVVLLVVGGLLAVGFFAGRDSGATATPTPTADPNAALPTGVSSDTYGVPYGAGWTAANEAKLPTLEIWEDFQCPICKEVEEVAGAQIEALADAGKVKLLYRPATFLDRNPTVRADNTANGNPNSSARATSAWGCAVDQGKSGEYHSAIFDAQPAQEGDGYSDQTLIDLGAQVGVADQAVFATCVQEGTYLPWAANSDAEFTKLSEAQANAGNSRFGTPAAFLNGTLISNSDLVDIAALTKLIDAATAK